jgi:hypothetical protein
MDQRKIIEGLLEIATPGPVKNSLWQAYQELQQAEQKPNKTSASVC